MISFFTLNNLLLGIVIVFLIWCLYEILLKKYLINLVSFLAKTRFTNKIQAFGVATLFFSVMQVILAWVYLSFFRDKNLWPNQDYNNSVFMAIILVLSVFVTTVLYRRLMLEKDPEVKLFVVFLFAPAIFLGSMWLIFPGQSTGIISFLVILTGNIGVFGLGRKPSGAVSTKTTNSQGVAHP